jgi:amino acid transporter
MSDIGLNLDGVIAFIAAIVLAALFAISILVVSFITVISARRRHQSITHQGLFPQVIGMSASLFVCLLIIITLLLAERLPPPRPINIWFDHWLWAWLLTVLALWPVVTYMWKRLRRKTPV